MKISVFLHFPAEDIQIRAGRLIWIDWIAGAVVGVLVLAFRGWLTDLYALPGELLLVMGLANLVYASVSFTLAMLSRGDHVPLLRVVATANIVWAVGCVVLAVVYSDRASVFGVGQLIGEAVFVGGLGVLEWRAKSNKQMATDGTDRTEIKPNGSILVSDPS